MREPVDLELERFVQEGILEPVEYCEWASQVAIVRKKNGSIRLCGDFKVSINEHIEANQHRIFPVISRPFMS